MNNLLPKDGTVNYYGKIFTEEQSEIYYVKLLNEINFYFNQKLLIKIRGHNLVTYRQNFNLSLINKNSASIHLLNQLNLRE